MAVKCHGLATCLYDDVTLHQAHLPEHATAAVFVCVVFAVCSS
jgi:hypothetical protein